MKYKSYAPFNNKRNRYWSFPCARAALPLYWMAHKRNAFNITYNATALTLPTPLDSHLQRKSSSTCESKNSNNSESWTQKKVKLKKAQQI